MRLLLSNLYLSLYYYLIFFSGDSAAVDEITDPQWVQFKRDFGKSYATPEEEESHHETFVHRLEEVAEQNKKFEAGLEHWKEGINQYSDLDYEELKSVLGLNYYEYTEFDY